MLDGEGGMEGATHALKSALKVAVVAVPSALLLRYAANMLTARPAWQKGLVEAGVGTVGSLALGAAGVEDEFAAGPMVGGVAMAASRAADEYQLAATLDRWRGASSTTTPASTTPGQGGAGTPPANPPGLVDENIAYARRARALGLG